MVQIVRRRMAEDSLSARITWRVRAVHMEFLSLFNGNFLYAWDVPSRTEHSKTA